MNDEKKRSTIIKTSVADDIDLYFRDVSFLVEANDNEQRLLWLVHHNQPIRRREVRNWEQETLGHGIEIGKCAGRPVVLSLFYARLNGKRVCFYYACSQIVDHEMVETWLKERTKQIRWDGGTRWAQCNGMNFHLCLQAIEEG